MAVSNLYATKYRYVNRKTATSSFASQEITKSEGYYSRLYLEIPALPSELRFKPILGANLYLYFSTVGLSSAEYLNYADEYISFNIETLTYAHNIPGAMERDFRGLWSLGVIDPGVARSGWAHSDFTLSAENTARFLKTPNKVLWVRDMYLSESLSIDTPLSSNVPYFAVEYGTADVGLIVSASSHQGGYINPHIASYFDWNVEPENENTVERPGQSDAVFAWKEEGSTTEHTITISDATQRLTVQAETFPNASSIQWQVRVHSTAGSWYGSEWYTLSTADTLATARPAAPSNEVVDGSSPIRFSWNSSNASGSRPTGADLEYSTNGGTTWLSLGSVSGATSEYTVPADLFTAGEIYWRVHAYNIDGIAGPWTETSFIFFASPDAPFVSVTAVPFAVISWQSAGQQAYEITIDGNTLGAVFGTEKQHVLKEPLSDGSHSVSVRVQGVYGLWSAPGSADVTITNDPGEDISLDGLFAVDAALSWSSADLTADFLIFRDGALIGHTDFDRFTDRFVLGSHSYYVINRLPSGNYSRSNTVGGKLCTNRPLIALLSGGEWLPLRYSERSMTQQSFTWTRTHSLRHIAGATFPLLELSPYEDLSGAYDVAFLSDEDAESFYRLRGQVVVLKSKDGKALIGAITSITSAVNTFYQAAQFTIEQIQWEDYVDDADG